MLEFTVTLKFSCYFYTTVQSTGILVWHSVHVHGGIYLFLSPGNFCNIIISIVLSDTELVQFLKIWWMPFIYHFFITLYLLLILSNFSHRCREREREYSYNPSPDRKRGSKRQRKRRNTNGDHFQLVLHSLHLLKEVIIISTWGRRWGDSEGLKRESRR